MKNKIKFISLFLLVGLVSACSTNISRNADGSLTVETSMTAESLQSEIRVVLVDPLSENITVQLKQGYIDVSVERKRLNSDQTDTLTFRLDLGVSYGHLTATISNAFLDSQPMDAARVANWNERIANRLENFSQRRSNSSLQSVTVTSNAIEMVWHVETARSQGN